MAHHINDTSFIEPPETPAPVFAVRAFKHAIFGTPQTTQAKPMRRSPTASDNPRSRVDEQRPTALRRPGMRRPKSVNDANAIEFSKAVQIPEPLPSPTKGILMTPGTVNARRKTVSFGDNVTDAAGMRPSKSGIPDDCPGKFPSPWVKTPGLGENHLNVQSTSRGRSKLMESLQQARAESLDGIDRAEKPSALEKEQDIEDVTLDLSHPRADSGKYWKKEYDIYRERTTREVKKLVAKQKAAKSFAREKDLQCTQLLEELSTERENVERLEKKSVELESQIKALTQQLVEAQNQGSGVATFSAGPTNWRDIIDPSRGRRTQNRMPCGYQRQSRASKHAEDTDAPTAQPTVEMSQGDLNPPTSKSHPELLSSTIDEDQRTSLAFSPDGPIMSESQIPTADTTKIGGSHYNTSQSLDPEIPAETRSLALSMGLHPPSLPIHEDQSKNALPCQPVTSHTAKSSVTDSDCIPVTSSKSRTNPSNPHSAADRPSLYDRPLNRSVPLEAQTSLREQTTTTTSNERTVRNPQNDTNVNPSETASRAPGLSEAQNPESALRPSAAWSALNGSIISPSVTASSATSSATLRRKSPIATQRSMDVQHSLVGRRGGPIDADRLEAAKARIAARGRVVS